MTEGDKPAGQRYSTIKERLWNQPRPRQILERLEENRASPALLETVGEKFASGEHGNAEIQSAICCELLRNRDRKAILKRVADLRSVLTGIHQDLLHAVSEIHQLRSWSSHQVMEYEDWAEFSEEVLGLSTNTTNALFMTREDAPVTDLDQFLQVMVKGYIVPSAPTEASPTALGVKRKRPDTEAIIKNLKDRLQRAELKAGEEIRTRKKLEQELEKSRAEMYRKVQEKQALIDKLTKNL